MIYHHTERRLLGSVIGLIVLASACASSSAALAAAQVRALFVGVADYRYGGPDSKIQDLQGAPNDVAMIRQALAARRPLDSELTLLGPEATRAAILSAVDSMTRDAAPGDTFLFYFSGHGRRFVTKGGDQADGHNVTIAAFDALPPGRIRPDRNYSVGDIGDVFDRELRLAFDIITARGVNVVTIFDSCNSGSATRSAFRKRVSKGIPEVPGLSIEAPQTPVLTAARSARPTAARPGYRVHFAAAPDGDVANEGPVIENGVEVWRSDFTVALSGALLEARPGASYQELLLETRTRLARAGADQQQVTTDGDLLTPFLGEAAGSVRVFEVADGRSGAWSLKAGSLSGVSPGSEFALFPTLALALDPGASPVARATVRSADAWTAQLAVSGPSGGLASGFARETRRSFGQTLLKVAVVLEDGAPPSERTRQVERDLRAQLRGLSAVKLVDRDPQIGFQVSADGSVSLWTADMRPIGRFVTGSAELAEATRNLAKFYTLLALEDGGQGPTVSFEASEANCQGTDTTPFERVQGEPSLHQGQEIYLTARNASDTPMFLYVFNLGHDHSVALIGASDKAVPAGRCWESSRLKAFGDGRDHLMMIASSKPLPNLWSLQQDAVQGLSRGIGDMDPLESLILGSQSGTRSTAPVAVGAWSVRRMTYSVRPDAG
ncbi:MAG: caspase family protein [Caulobacter sp.]|nr:caspase family protein [Caulobacter sp.]